MRVSVEAYDGIVLLFGADEEFDPENDLHKLLLKEGVMNIMVAYEDGHYVSYELRLDPGEEAPG